MMNDFSGNSAACGNAAATVARENQHRGPLRRRGQQRLAVLLLLAAAGLSACLKPGGALQEAGQRPRGLHVGAAFGPDGKLWRVIADKRQIYVDYSSDQGNTFSAPASINADAQRIKTSSENRPGIAVDSANRIFVIYPAEGDKQPVEVYFSVSMDGKQFSPPAAVSDKAAEANAFQGSLALSPQDQAYVFWHDERNRADWKQAGNAIYYTVLESTAPSVLASNKAADVLCECCKIAAAFDPGGKPVLLARFIYPGGIRDHGLIAPGGVQNEWLTRRVTFDDWRIEACPEHGPALTISANGDYHIAWFTQGSVRNGLFYAHSTDGGLHFSAPMPFGATNRLAGHPAIIAVKQRIVLAWKEFDGAKSRVFIMQSQDGGKQWSAPTAAAETASEADAPLLIKHGQAVFLSWNSKESYRLIPVSAL